MPGPGRNRIFIVVFVSLALLTVLLLSALPGSPLNILTSPLSAVLEPIQKGLIGLGEQVSGFYVSVTDGLRIRRENTELAEENAALRSRIAQLEEAGRQYQELKDAFLLKDRFDSYDILGGRILTRDMGLWFDVFRIDRGRSDGLVVTETLSYAVINAQSHLVGRVLSTDLVAGKVLPLLHEGFVVSGKVDVVGGTIVRIRGDLNLKEQGLCRVDQIPAGASLQPGDVLVTSGIGGLFPAGIPIGSIELVVDSSTPGMRWATLRPFADLERLSTVFVMRGRP